MSSLPFADVEHTDLVEKVKYHFIDRRDVVLCDYNVQPHLLTDKEMRDLAGDALIYTKPR